MTARRELPSGTVTFLFSDIEGSTRLLEELGRGRYAAELQRHRSAVRQAVAANKGVELSTEGDAFFVAFATASDALETAEAAQAALAGGPIRVRMGIHTGEPIVVDDGYVGLDVHRAARICDAANGGQVLVSQATRDLAGRELRDLGSHRLKDLSAAERLYQLGAATFPVLRTLRRTTLPVQPTPLFGREAELAELVSLLRRNTLLTLTGPGGAGKTRLALELAATVTDDYRDGVWWVPLAAVADPAMVLPEIGEIVDARGDVSEFLATRRLLLLLDNFEQVVGAAPRVAELLARAPDVRVIATSRERLALSGEQEYPVPPLADAAAAELFVTRARQVQPRFEPDESVIEICHRLDGLPLALELASTRVKLMAPRQIAERLDRRLDLLTGGPRDLPARQATMRAAIDWSYDLLSEREQRALRSLGVFIGGFELEAAQAVCDADLDVVQSLVEKSLIRLIDTERFLMLETIREYALERLEEAGAKDELRRRHAEWFVALAESARARLHSAEQGAWLARLQADSDNLGAVLDWTLDHDPPVAVELATTLFHSWLMRGKLDALVSCLERALADPDALEPAVRAQALSTYGNALTFSREDYAMAERVLNESLALHRRLGLEGEGAVVLLRLGIIAWARGDLDRAKALREEALATFRRIGDNQGIARALHLLGEELGGAGELESGAAMLEEAVAIDRERGDKYAVSSSLHSLGDLALDAGDLERATALYREALSIDHDLGDERSQAYCLAGLASVAARAGDTRSAARRWGAVRLAEDNLGVRFLAVERARYERHLGPLAAAADFAASEGRELTLDAAVNEALHAKPRLYGTRRIDPNK
jgi:predicted ATPase/class 3 adenylate cyclase